MASDKESTEHIPKTLPKKPYFLKDKVVDFEEKLKILTPYNLPKLYKDSGVYPYFEMRDSLHNEEWLEFYQNAEIADKDATFFETTVKGKTIKITVDTISNITGAKCDGVKVYSEDWTREIFLPGTDINVTEETIDEDIFVPEGLQLKKPSGSSLIPECRVLHALNTYTVLPRRSGKNSIRKIDKWVLFNISQGFEIHLPDLLFNYLKQSILSFKNEESNVLVYGVLITKILRSFEIVLSPPSTPVEQIKYMDPGPFKKMKGTVQNMLLKYNNEIGGVWRTKKRKPNVEEGESSQPQKKQKQNPTEADPEYVPTGYMPTPSIVVGESSNAQEKTVDVQNHMEEDIAQVPYDNINTQMEEDTEQVTHDNIYIPMEEDHDQVLHPNTIPVPEFRVIDLVETQSEMEIYERFKTTNRAITADHTDYVPEGESDDTASCSVQLVMESKKLIKKVLKDAKPEIKHAKKEAKERKKERRIQKQLEEQQQQQQEIQEEEQEIQEEEEEIQEEQEEEIQEQEEEIRSPNMERTTPHRKRNKRRRTKKRRNLYGIRIGRRHLILPPRRRNIITPAPPTRIVTVLNVMKVLMCLIFFMILCRELHTYSQTRNR